MSEAEKNIFTEESLEEPKETFREFIKECYQQNKLITNQLELGGRLVDLRNLTMPLLNIYGKFDHLVPPGACEKLTSAVGSTDVEDVCIDTGHIGIYVSSKCQREFTPKISAWLTERDGEAVNSDPKPVKKKPVKKAPAMEN